MRVVGGGGGGGVGCSMTPRNLLSSSSLREAKVEVGHIQALESRVHHV